MSGSNLVAGCFFFVSQIECIYYVLKNAIQVWCFISSDSSLSLSNLDTMHVYFLVKHNKFDLWLIPPLSLWSTCIVKHSKCLQSHEHCSCFRLVIKLQPQSCDPIQFGCPSVCHRLLVRARSFERKDRDSVIDSNECLGV